MMMNSEFIYRCHSLFAEVPFLKKIPIRIYQIHLYGIMKLSFSLIIHGFSSFFISWINKSTMDTETTCNESCLGSISPTFYAQLLRTQVVSAAFLCPRFRFIFYWRKPTAAKAAGRTLMKLSPGYHNLNFTWQLVIRNFSLKMILWKDLSNTC